MNEDRDREMAGMLNRKEQRWFSRSVHFTFGLLLVVSSQHLFAQSDVEHPVSHVAEKSLTLCNEGDNRQEGRSPPPESKPLGSRKDADVFGMWERGVPAEEVYRAVAEDGEFSPAEVLGAADVVLELKDLIAKEQAGGKDPKRLAKLRKELKAFDAVLHCVLRNSRGGRA